MRSLRGRLTAGLLLGSGLLLTVGGVVLRQAIASRLQREFDQALLARARSLVSLTEQQDGRVWIDLNDEVMPEFRSREKPVYFEVWLADGRILARSPSLGRADLPRSGAPVDRVRLADGALPDGRAGRRVEIRFPPQFEALEDEGREGKPRPAAAPGLGVAPVTLVVAQGREELDAFLHAVDVTLTLGILGLLAGTAALTKAVLAIGLRPLDELARRLEAMDAGSLGRELELPGAPAELQPVVRHLQGLLARLKASFERERAFSSNLAHELRTPLTELRAAAEVALKWPEDSSGWLASFEEVRAIGAQMERVVENLLALARCEEREPVVESSEVSLYEVAVAAWRNLGAEASAKGMELALAIPQELRVVTDRGKLALILSNLLGNAVAHGAPGSRVELSAAATGNEFSLTVRNATDALTPGDLPRLFDRFWRKDTARSGGKHAGLGLSLVAALSDLLGLRKEARLADGVFELTLVGPVHGRGAPG